MAKQELGPNQLKWIEALESDRFPQGTNFLCDDEGAYCCLGVGCEVAGLKGTFREADDDECDDAYVYGKERSADVAPVELMEFLALRSSLGALSGQRLNGHPNLVEANDSGCVSFAEVAEFCREHPEAAFTEPR